MIHMLLRKTVNYDIFFICACWLIVELYFPHKCAANQVESKPFMRYKLIVVYETGCRAARVKQDIDFDTYNVCLIVTVQVLLKGDHFTRMSKCSWNEHFNNMISCVEFLLYNLPQAVQGV